MDEVACVTTRICFARRDWDSVYGFGTILIECRNSTDGARSVSKTLATGCVRATCATAGHPVRSASSGCSGKRFAPTTDASLRTSSCSQTDTKLVTLRDAANVLLDVFTLVNAPAGVLDHAIGSLLTAAETGKRVDLVEATETIERARRLL